MVYTAGSVSLAALELLAHLEAPHLLAAYVCIPVDLAEGLCERVDLARMPADWTASPAPTSTREIGTQWARSQRSAVLVVPSALVPQESLFLLNPQHPDLARIRIGTAWPFAFDPRILKSA
jgi:RES domain-containing protein